MENIGILIIVAIIVALIIAFIVGRATRKAKTEYNTPKHAAGASAEFTKRGH